MTPPESMTATPSSTSTGRAPARVLVVDTEEAAAHLTSEAKLTLLRHLIDEPLTIADLARRVGSKAPAVTFHVKAMVASGLVRPVGSVQRRALTATVYRATAQHYDASDLVDRLEDPTLLPRSVAAAACTRVRELAARGPVETLTCRVVSLRLDHARTARLKAELRELIERYSAEQEDDGARTVGLQLHAWAADA